MVACPLIINRVKASEGTGKTVGQLKPVRGGKPSQNTQLPVFPQDYDVAISMLSVCIGILPNIVAAHA